MKKSKHSNSYYIDMEIIEWVAGEAAKARRSASSYLNDLLHTEKDKSTMNTAQ